MRNPFASNRPATADVSHRLALYESAFRDSRIGMAVVDDNGFIIDANAALAEFLGYTLEELTSGKLTFVDVTHPDDVLADISQFSDLIAGKITGYHFVKRYVRKDGTHRWGRLNVVKPRGKRYAIEIVVGQVEDIQELKDKIAALSKTESELRRINRELRDLVSLVGQEKHTALLGELGK